MNKKIRFLPLIIAFTISSCSIGSSDNINESSTSSCISEVEIEPADPNGFDPNFNYIGYDAVDFEIIASQYNANCQFKTEQVLHTNYYPTESNYGIITFPFRGTSIIAFHENRKITEIRRLESEKLTISKALRLGGLHKYKSRSYIYSYYTDHYSGYYDGRYREVAVKNATTDMIRCSYDDFVEEHYSYLPKRKYIEFFKKCGIPTSMFVYYNKAGNYEYECLEGVYYLGLIVETASAFPIYSDDLQEIVGVMTAGAYSSGQISEFNFYFKEDGFDKIKKIQPIIEQIRDPEVEVIENPCFYIEDTSKLPRGDWRIMLSEGSLATIY